MGNCSICGAETSETDLIFTSGRALCRNCESSGAYSTDAPCSRCGVYIPRTEMQMYKSRLFCSYCIMDIKHDEKEHENQGAKDGAHGAGAGVAGIEITEKKCDICGRQTDIMYYFSAIKVCPVCKEGLDPDIDKVTKKGFGVKIPILSQLISTAMGRSRKFTLRKGIRKEDIVGIIGRNANERRLEDKKFKGFYGRKIDGKDSGEKVNKKESAGTLSKLLLKLKEMAGR